MIFDKKIIFDVGAFDGSDGLMLALKNKNGTYKSEKSKGIKNSNSVRYILFNTISNEVVEIDGYKSVLNYFNSLTNSNKKDAMFLIKKIKENQIDELKFISSVKINSSI